ncbi:recombinase family protein [Aliivibrio sp. EL58]|uniref:recombinase family protein n=1 Tax=Aliivibrio sp. EL58 TaxID=2107582 RepID=UPI000EFCFFD9|nr:recombinase family protein [Aliivibrio sp. EL58]
MKKQVYSYVRVSSIQQVQKTGIQRQVSKAKQWALDNGYTFNDTFIDQGVSAYKGNNVSSGELGSFIEAVKSGAVPRGSILVIEALDRLSRQDISKAMRQFLELTGLGLEIVTLSDNQLYSEESIGENGMQLMMSLMFMMKANEESKLKSERISDAKKRAYDKGVKGEGLVSGHIPYWLVWNGKQFSENHHADVIRTIFEMVKNGLSFSRIAECLNNDGIPLPPSNHENRKNRAIKWTATRCQKVVRDKKVIGLLKSSKGDVSNYYPVTVSLSDFYEAQAIVDARSQRRPSQNTMTNLFSGFIKCDECKGGLTIRTGAKHKMTPTVIKRSGFTFMCNAKNNKGYKCDFKTMHSFSFEKMILECIPLLDISPIKDVDKRPALRSEMDELNQQQSNLVDNLMNLSGSAADAIQKRLQVVSDRIDVVLNLLDDEEQKQNIETPKITYSNDDIESILDKGNVDLRQKTNNALQLLVKDIYINKGSTRCNVELYNGEIYFISWDKVNDYSKVRYSKHNSDTWHLIRNNAM